jgi:hypothetical protein
MVLLSNNLIYLKHLQVQNKIDLSILFNSYEMREIKIKRMWKFLIFLVLGDIMDNEF